MKKKLIIAAALVLVLLAPAAAFAQTDAVSQGLFSSNIRSLFGFGGLNQSTTLTGLLSNIILLILRFVGLIAVLFIIIGGYRYITSQGNAEQAEAGQKTLVNAVIGLVIIALAYVIVTVVVNTVNSSGGLFG